jgi:hypothetical protein
MWAIITAVLVSLLGVVLEIPALKALKQYREMALFALLTAGSLALYIMVTLGVPLPNPLEWISAIYGRLGIVMPK